MPLKPGECVSTMNVLTTLVHAYSTTSLGVNNQKGISYLSTMKSTTLLTACKNAQKSKIEYKHSRV